MKIKSLIITLFMLSTLVVRSQIPLSAPIFLWPTGDEREGQPVFKVMTTSDPQFRKARHLFDRGFTNHVVTLYKMAQQYQVTQGRWPVVDEAYLAFTKNTGGYARTGFWLETPGGIVHKAGTGYVDLHENMLESDRDEIAAPPQIFSHEMGHLIMKVLTLTPDDDRSSPSPVAHYFTTTTDYVTAFDEGFAEHLQYMTVELERNQKVKDTIANKLRLLKLKVPRTMYGYQRDYDLPLRMGFFAATMPLWYQQIENIRRISFIKNNWAKMPARVPRGVTNTGDYIHYRNASVWPNPAGTRTYAQAMSIEGIVATFFSNIMLNDMAKNYMAPQVYRAFIPDTSIQVPQQIDITTNQYLKMFKVIAGDVTLKGTNGGPLSGFMEAYVKKFPQETVYLNSCWETASGHPFHGPAPAEIWVTNKEFSFNPHAMGPFGPSVPYYTFNINTADTVDLMTFNELDRADAEKILAWRIQNNGFSTLEDVGKTPGVDPAKLAAITRSGYEVSTIDEQKTGNSSWVQFLLYPIVHLLKMTLLWFIILGIIYAVAMAKYASLIPTPRRLAMLLLKLLMFVVVALLIKILSSKLIFWMLLFTLVVLAVNYLVNRKKGKLMWVSMASTATIGLVMLYSLW